MKVLYKEKDLFDIIKEYILPCLEENICDLEKYFNRGDMDALRCVDKILNKRIVARPPENCEYITIEGKKVCSKHCKALPFYKHLKKIMGKHERSSDIFIHFRVPKPLSYAIANMFKNQYKHKIKRDYRHGRWKGCCEKQGHNPRWPSGWHTTVRREKKNRIMKEYADHHKIRHCLVAMEQGIL